MPVWGLKMLSYIYKKSCHNFENVHYVTTFIGDFYRHLFKTYRIYQRSSILR